MWFLYVFRMRLLYMFGMWLLYEFGMWFLYETHKARCLAQVSKPRNQNVCVFDFSKYVREASKNPERACVSKGKQGLDILLEEGVITTLSVPFSSCPCLVLPCSSLPSQGSPSFHDF